MLAGAFASHMRQVRRNVDRRTTGRPQNEGSMYKIIRATGGIDRGNNTLPVVDAVLQDLEGQVNAAIGDGWECVGGVQYVTRPAPHGVVHVAMQGMAIDEAVYRQRVVDVVKDVKADEKSVAALAAFRASASNPENAEARGRGAADNVDLVTHVNLNATQSPFPTFTKANAATDPLPVTLAEEQVKEANRTFASNDPLLSQQWPSVATVATPAEDAARNVGKGKGRRP